MSREWLSSAEASRRLGVSSATLYAYVSRGLLRSEGATGQREKRYSADDVTRLKRRRDVGRKAESIAANALDFGTPVLESSLTLIENGVMADISFLLQRVALNADPHVLAVAARTGLKKSDSFRG